MTAQRLLKHLILLRFVWFALAGIGWGAPPAVSSWMKMPLLTPEQQSAGIFPGGEGAQWPRGPVAVSPANPQFLLLPIDVGGLYRSLDGGAHWEMAMVGWNARGANGFGMDPRNPLRTIGIGANSVNWNINWGPSPHGLYLTTNQAASWTQVLAFDDAFGGSVQFDPTSFDSKRDYCSRAYYYSAKQQLFRSDDGGATWRRLGSVPEAGAHAGGDWSSGLEPNPQMELDARSGALYLGGQRGLFRSTDHGQSWMRVKPEPVFSLAVSRVGRVVVSDPGRLWSSRDAGITWEKLSGSGLNAGEERKIQDLVISPANPKRMLCWTSGKNFQWTRYYTHDGGQTWQPVKTEREGAPLPMNGREGHLAWSPTDPNVAWCIGGDWVVKSTDGGATFHWSNNGYNGIMLGGLFNFSAHSPNTVYLGFQDYNGAFTTNGGATWNYRDVSGKGWGGHQYGAFALNASVMWSGDADSWNAARFLRVSRDGGTAWTTVSGADGRRLEYEGADVSCGDPADANVGFAGKNRTADAGKTWQVMPGCDAVYTADANHHILYGMEGNTLVSSADHGANWKRIAEIHGGAVDLAVDPKSGRIYAASEDRLKVWSGGTWSVIETPSDQYGNQRVCTVAVDPQVPAIVYVGGSRNTYATHAAVCRSTDSGKTWTNLTVTQPLGPDRRDGPHEVSAIRVHPLTREAWVAGQCFGLWRIGAPAPDEIGLPAAQASAPRAPHVPKAD